MKPITKIIIFLIVAFVIVLIITFTTRGVVAPTTTTNTPVATSTPSSAVSGTVVGGSYTLAQVAMHKTTSDCWTAVGGNVFNVTAFVSQHPGGVPNISKVCGIDATAIFTAQHGSNANAQAALASLKIGTLAK